MFLASALTCTVLATIQVNNVNNNDNDKNTRGRSCAQQRWMWLQMEGMVTDLQLARDKQQGFEDWKRENAADKPMAMDLQVTVLTTGFWPSYKVCIAAQYLKYCFACSNL